MRLLLTRPLERARAFAARLPDELDVHISPVLRVRHLPLQKHPLPSNQTLIFTSQTAVTAASEQGITSEQTVLCVGDATAALAERAGYAARSAGGNVDALFQICIAHQDTAPFWHLRGAHTTGELTQRLRTVGIAAHESVIYRQDSLELDAKARGWLTESEQVLLPLFSPRSAMLTLKDAAPNPSVQVIAISAAAKRKLAKGWRGNCTIAAKPTAAAMVDAINDQLARHS